MVSGEWRVESGEWRVESGECRWEGEESSEHVKRVVSMWREEGACGESSEHVETVVSMWREVKQGKSYTQG